jgi:flagellar motility protein MotE (MotC chaperone)
MRIRLLHLLILVAALGVGTRLGGVFVEVSGKAQANSNILETGGAAAAKSLPVQHHPGGAAAAKSLPVQHHPVAQLGAGVPGRAREVRAVDPQSGANPIFQTTTLSPDPFHLSDEEFDLLQSLAERRQQLERRERRIDQRGALLSAAETRVEKKIAELETLKATIEGLLEQHEAQSNKRIASLVKIYSSMKPKDAARILEELDSVVLLQVIRQMPERVSAGILAEMSAKRAKTITVELAEANTLPMVRE